MSVDLEKLAKQVDEALAKETPESLNKWLNERRQKAETGEEQCNLPIVTAPLLWKDVLDDFYVEHDRKISNGEYKGKMILMFRDWLEKNYQVPERNGR